jgi:hypothetical protein
VIDFPNIYGNPESVGSSCSSVVRRIHANHDELEKQRGRKERRNEIGSSRVARYFMRKYNYDIFEGVA